MTAAVRPGPRFLLAHPAHAIALGFGSGLSRWAPGTVGTLWAWVAWLMLERGLAAAGLVGGPDFGAHAMAGAGMIVAAAALGLWACTVTAQHLGSADPGAIVWDEVLAFWCVLWLLLPATLLEQLAAFALFRLFDAAKPGPVRWADRLFKLAPGQPIGWRQGFGILFDDLVAALCTLVVIALWRTGS